MPDALDEVLLALELRLLDPPVRRDRSQVDALLAPEFREVGRSGRLYNKQDILDLLASEQPFNVQLENFAVQTLGPEAALATYTSVHADGRASRASVWVRREERWVMLYHQGMAVS